MSSGKRRQKSDHADDNAKKQKQQQQQQSATTTSTKNKTNKRARSKAATSTKNNKNDADAALSPPKRRPRPDPPPDHPLALVELLKRDKQVLRYFKSLQENLEADVTKWKDRARYFEGLYQQTKLENERLLLQQSTTKTATKNKNQRGKQPQKDDNDENDENGEYTTTTTTATTTRDDETMGNHGTKKTTTKKAPPTALHRTANNRTNRKNNNNNTKKNDGPPIDTINLLSTTQTQDHEAAHNDEFAIHSSSDDDDDDDDRDDDIDKKASQQNKQPLESSRKNDNHSADPQNDKEPNTINEDMEESFFDFVSDNDDDDNDNDNDNGSRAKDHAHSNHRDGYRKMDTQSTRKPLTTTTQANGNENKNSANDHNGDNSTFDEAFQMLLSSDDDSDDNDDNEEEQEEKHEESLIIKNGATPKSPQATTLGESEVALLGKQHGKFILSELVDAYQCLQHLGVELVDKQIIIEEEHEIEGGTVTEFEKDKQTFTKENAATSNVDVDDSDDEEARFSFLPAESDTQALKRELAGSVPKLPKTVFHRRDNEEVVKEMLFTLRNLTQINIQVGGLSDEFQAFRVAPFWIPCGDLLPMHLTSNHNNDNIAAPDHPARVGKICLFRALCVMDTYCSPGCLRLAPPHDVSAGTLIDPNWDELFQQYQDDQDTSLVDADILKAIMVGMRDRKEMVHRFMQSLTGEMSENWAIMDRAERIKVESLIYEEQQGDTTEHLSDDSDDHDKGDEDSRLNGLDDKNHDELALLSKPITSSLTRLSNIAERRILAQILVNLYFFRNDPQRAFDLVYAYILSAVPSLELEDYPRLQPALSMLVLEGMLSLDGDLSEIHKAQDDNDNHRHSNDGGENAPHISWFTQRLNKRDKELETYPNLTSSLRQVLSLCVHATAFIWRKRLACSDTRIADVARVEVASYRRLLKTQNSWLQTFRGSEVEHECEIQSHMEDQIQACNKLIDNFQQDLISSAKKDKEIEVKESFDITSASQTLSLALILLGDHEKSKALFLSGLEWLRNEEIQHDDAVCSLTKSVFRVFCSASCAAFRQLEIRRLEDHRQSIGCFVSTAETGSGESLIVSLNECLSRLHEHVKEAMKRMSLGKSQKQESNTWMLASTLLDCSTLAADGELANEVVELVLRHDTTLGKKRDVGNCTNFHHRHLFESIERAGRMPVVRVVNLKRRKDRMALMISQGIHSDILIVKGVATLEDTKHEPSWRDFYGGYAVDGKLKKEEIIEQLFPQTGSKLETFVTPRWRPHDLKAFDTKARNDQNALIWISESERACALSHISAWKGVLRSLAEPLMLSEATSDRRSTLIFQHRQSLRRLFLHSGFARGNVLDPKNSEMDPVPVCVILEDDAVLDDRFVDRLDLLLEELPRDFHFCLLGYGRPNTAPLVKFSSQLCIPTFTWYLTGYLLSLEGAKYLLESLPVCGPVDSWIGLKMVSNWDNKFGTDVGVGMGTNSTADAPSKKDLATILKFRAFAALEPLCSQKIGVATAGFAGSRWRQRDTDIIASSLTNQ